MSARDIANLSRRGVLGGIAGGLILGLRIDGFTPFSTAEAAEKNWSPNVYLTITPAGDVVVTAHRSEMGTGIRTGLPQILADELEADWRRLRIVQAMGDKIYGSQNTDGSCSIRDFYGVMRQAGATARHMLELAAAAKWNVPAAECAAKDHGVVHGPTGQRFEFAELVGAAAGLPVPPAGTVALKSKSAFHYVGKPLPVVDLDDILRGKAIYGIDVVRDGMRHASIERCPVYGGKVKRFDPKKALAVPGVEQVIELPATPPPSGFKPLGGIAVIATNSWAAQQGRQKLDVEWDLGPNAGFDTESYRKSLTETAQRPGKVARRQGDVNSALAGAAKRVVADYFVPHLAHASMEPPATTASFRDGSCEVWSATQNPQQTRTTVAQVLGIEESAVSVHVTLLGGGFGRKSKPDYAAEAALLSKLSGRPIKVTWTREDDLKHDYYHAICAQHLEGALDRNGKVTAWLHRTVFPPIPATFKPDVVYAGPGDLGQGVTDLPFAIPNIQAENGPAPNHVRIGWYRSVMNVPHAFAIGSFVDELADAAKRDRVAFWNELLGPARRVDLKAIGVEYENYGASMEDYPIDTARHRAVLERVAKASDWGRKLPPREGLGLALHRSFVTYVAVIAHVAVAETGAVTVKRLDVAADCGLVVNPDRVRAQFEGAAIMGISNTLFSAITFSNGSCDQANLSDYLVARMDSTPELHVHVVPSEAPPAGVGEPGVPPVAPAICNAIFAATGRRIRQLPVDPAALKLA